MFSNTHDEVLDKVMKEFELAKDKILSNYHEQLVQKAITALIINKKSIGLHIVVEEDLLDEYLNNKIIKVKFLKEHSVVFVKVEIDNLLEYHINQNYVSFTTKKDDKTILVVNIKYDDVLKVSSIDYHNPVTIKITPVYSIKQKLMKKKYGYKVNKQPKDVI